MLELGKIETADVPAIMADYELCDMAQELWVWRTPDRKLLCIQVDAIDAVATSQDPNQLLRMITDDCSEWCVPQPKSQCELISVSLGKIVEHEDAVIYTSYPHKYRLILRNPGDTP
jgi:hypothetical protein